MGKKSGGSPPPAPDPAATAAAQGAANKEAVYESARVNQINEATPYGAVSYSGEIGSPDRTRTTSLAPEQQSQFDQQNQLAEILGGAAINRGGQVPMDPFAIQANLPRVGDFSGDDMERAQYGRALELMQPEMERQERSFETTMANRGIPLGGEAYNDARGQFDRSRDDMLSGAAFNAMNAGNAEQGRQYGLARTEYGDALNRQLTERQQPMNELAAILQGTPAFQSPTAGSTAQYQVAPADYMGATFNKYQGDMNAYNQQQNSRNSMLGGLAQLGGAAIPFLSDRRLKKNITPVGERNGVKWYSFEYLWDTVKHIGVMAQEIIETHPDAVHRLPSGYYAVDYGRLS